MLQGLKVCRFFSADATSSTERTKLVTNDVRIRLARILVGYVRESWKFSPLKHVGAKELTSTQQCNLPFEVVYLGAAYPD